MPEVVPPAVAADAVDPDDPDDAVDPAEPVDADDADVPDADVPDEAEPEAAVEAEPPDELEAPAVSEVPESADPDLDVPVLAAVCPPAVEPFEVEPAESAAPEASEADPEPVPEPVPPLLEVEPPVGAAGALGDPEDSDEPDELAEPDEPDEEFPVAGAVEDELPFPAGVDVAGAGAVAPEDEAGDEVDVEIDDDPLEPPPSDAAGLVVVADAGVLEAAPVFAVVVPLLSAGVEDEFEGGKLMIWPVMFAGSAGVEVAGDEAEAEHDPRILDQSPFLMPTQ